MIVGGPGIGKSMLANTLMIDHIARGWEAVAVTADISEADDAWDTDQRQIFHYDDFLGRVRLAEGGLKKNEDARIVDFIQRVQSHKNKRLILTTREYILQDARMRYERLDEAPLTKYEYILKLGDYTRLIRARILYNHLYFSELRTDLKRALLADKSYLRVIDHRNYSPRLIQHITDAEKANDLTPAEFPRFVFRVLADPAILWRHIFENQLDRAAQQMLLCLASMPDRVLFEDLTNAMAGRIDDSPVAFRHALRTLEGTFVQINAAGDDRVIRFRDPSISDFLLSWLSSNPMEVDRLLESARYFEQCATLWSYRHAVTNASHDSVGASLASQPPVQVSIGPLVAAMRRTIKAQSSVVNLHITDQGVLTYRRTSIDAVARARLIIDVADASQSEDAINLARSVLKSIPDEWIDVYIAKRSTLELAKRIRKCRQPLRSAVDDFAVSVKTWFTSELNATDDYIALLGLRESWPEILTDDELADYEAQFVEFARETAQAASWSGDRDEIKDALSDLQRGARQFGLDLDEDLQALESRLESLPDEEEDEEEEEEEFARPPDAGTVMSGLEETREIDGLFETLN